MPQVDDSDKTTFQLFQEAAEGVSKTGKRLSLIVTEVSPGQHRIEGQGDEGRERRDNLLAGMQNWLQTHSEEEINTGMKVIGDCIVRTFQPLGQSIRAGDTLYRRAQAIPSLVASVERFKRFLSEYADIVTGAIMGGAVAGLSKFGAATLVKAGGLAKLGTAAKVVGAVAAAPAVPYVLGGMAVGGVVAYGWRRHRRRNVLLVEV